ncbi:gluconokinase [Gloeocapsa sp. PCC 73106]|uniref:gluconokinase n=1 Tax=Gloeocapsa sp. PCC 73106 TaxID=102232 RepID=UPI0002ABC435|nr:gluconokinase [Gloeocapsa sp. PCC 73106]ELR98241.1 carbohydrate kinase, thermoresistant glucokinase family [Gloeocapsa sp. PCC 73106]
MICIIAGVSGSGKSTIGKLLGQRLGWDFYDGDDFHPPENIEKISRGIALSDADRQLWLLALKNIINDVLFRQKNAVIACSALKISYRYFLQGNHQNICWIYLKGTYEQILERMKLRQDHFMKPEMLRSQFDILEEPAINTFVINISHSPDEIIEQIMTLGISQSS